MSEKSNNAFTLPLQRLEYLVRLPILLNSSLASTQVIKIALDQLKLLLKAEAATVFLIDAQSGEVRFWALRGNEEVNLDGKRIPKGKGIVGWVIEHNQGVLVEDVSKDPRFFRAVDEESAFVTRDLLCVPLVVRGERTIGAVQVLNSTVRPFQEKDLEFLDQCANQIALAVDNALLYESLREKNIKLETLEKRRSDMLAVISHEIRTPLNVIQNVAELVVSGVLDKDGEDSDLMKSLRRGVGKLVRLTGQLQNLSMITEDSLELSNGLVAPSALLRRAEAYFSGAASRRKLQQNYSADPTLEVMKGDEALLQIALNNLISNAIRYTPDGGSIQISVESGPGTAIFRVRDSGVGIAASDLPLISEKFFQVIPSIEHHSGDLEFKSGGLGIGLATVKAILAAHGSAMEIKSELGKGSDFSFAIALAKA